MRPAALRSILLAACVAGCQDTPGPAQPKPIEGVVIQGLRDNLPVGDTMQLTVVAYDAGGARIGPIVDVQWSSLDSGRVSVTPGGTALARSIGSPARLVARSSRLTAAGLPDDTLLVAPTQPVVTIQVESPLADAVLADSAVRLRATCTVESNTGRRCASLVATADGKVLARGVDHLDTVATVTGFVAASIRFVATDSVQLPGAPVYGQEVAASRMILFGNSGFRLVGKFGEIARDFDGEHALYDASGPEFGFERALWFQGIGEAARPVAVRAFEPHLVTPGVAWYVKQPGSTFTAFELYEWRNGVTTLLGDSVHHVTPIVEGTYGVWSQQEGSDTALYRRDIAAGVTVRVATGARGWASGANPYYVTPGGDVYFIRGSSPIGAAGLYRWSGGSEQLVRAGSFDFVRADGTSLLLREQGGAIRLITPAAEEVLDIWLKFVVNSGATVVIGRGAGLTSDRRPLYDLYTRGLVDPTLTRVASGVATLVLVRRNGDVVAGTDRSCFLSGPTRTPLRLPSCVATERNGHLYVMFLGYVFAVD